MDAAAEVMAQAVGGSQNNSLLRRPTLMSRLRKQPGTRQLQRRKPKFVILRTNPPCPVRLAQQHHGRRTQSTRKTHGALLQVLPDPVRTNYGRPTMTVASPANTGLDGASEPQAQPSRSKSRRGLWAAIIALSVVALAAGSGFAYSSNSARTWHDTSTRTATELGTTQRQRDELKTQLASTQSQLDGTKRDLGDLTGKYKEATDRIRALANEKAQVGDKAAYLDETVAISNLVTKELGGCVDNLQTLQGYLVNFQNYDSTQLINYATDINNACNQARSDNAILAKRLAGL
jgi:hypothetical protein